MRKIITILPFKWNFDKKFFNKDIIQIWRTFMVEKKFISEFWAINNNEKLIEFNYLGQKWRWFKSFFSIIINLIKEWKKINLLHLYHIWRHPFTLWVIYKLVNPKWKIYLKTDVSYRSTNWKIILNFNKYVLNIYYYIFNYIWFEDKVMLKNAKRRFPKYKNKFYYIPSWTIYSKKYDWKLNKKNIISLCWRFWDKIKNYELLINTLKEYNIDFLKDWKIYFIWEYTDNFLEKINHLITKKPELKNIIRLKWFITNKDNLYKLLSESKIFIHTANSEWEPNVQFDSMFCWCYMISTDVWTIRSNYPKQFSSFIEINDKEWLLKKLKSSINKIDNINYNNIQNHCIENFVWKKSLKVLLDKF